MEGDLSEIVRNLSKRVGKEFYRAIIYSEGLVELEFETSNPWECLVIRADGLSELRESLEQDPHAAALPIEVVLRKKCLKCFLHERRVEGADLIYQKT